MLGLNPMELVIIGIVAVLLFGNKLPKVARSFGQSIVEFKKGFKDIGDAAELDLDAKPQLTQKQS